MSFINSVKPYSIFGDASRFDQGALDQFQNVLDHPSVIRGSLLPDCHLGYTVPIGCVFQSDGMIFPSAVGYDIGCGVLGVKTTITRYRIEPYKNKIYDLITSRIPLGKNHRDQSSIWTNSIYLDNCTKEMREIYIGKGGDKQLGTLGGGNHFIEIGEGTDGHVWIIIHSGSRGVGHGCAEHYMKLASESDKAEEKMNGFRTDTVRGHGHSYIRDMYFCLDWALINRKAMMYEVLGIIVNNISDRFYSEVEPFIDTFINTNHNHAESKDGVLWTHRKGATHADIGMLGVIPGNMHDGSYIIQGKGNIDSMCSSSHGAGRLMSRSKAKDTLSVDEFVDIMKDIVSGAGRGKLDESPKAYKNFNEVMDFQTDLVDIIDVVRPIINVKG